MGENIDTQVQTQTKTQTKVFLVRVVEGKRFNLHIWNLKNKQQLVIKVADQYVLLQNLITYVLQHGVKKTYKAYYAPRDLVYEHEMWDLQISSDELFSLLTINNFNKRSYTLQHIISFISK